MVQLKSLKQVSKVVPQLKAFVYGQGKGQSDPLPLHSLKVAAHSPFWHLT